MTAHHPRFVVRLALALFFLFNMWTVRPLWATDEPPAAPISPTLQRQLEETEEPVSFLVVLRDQVDAEEALAKAGLTAADRLTRGEYLYDTLTARAQADQAELRALLDRRQTPYRAFYLINMLEVTGDAALATELSMHPAVARIEANPQIAQSSLGAMGASAEWLTYLNMPAARSEAPTASLPWGLENIGATQLWADGYTGQGIVVAGQDTGVDWEHPALQPRYRGWDAEAETADHQYNWFDAWADDARPASCDPDPQTPCDDHGHGTHTVGTMLGLAAGTEPAIGVAPDAVWMACRNMLYGVGTPASYTACFEFFLAPYPQDGDPMTDGMPELAPHVINNSWGCPPSEGCSPDDLRQIVETVRAAGIFVVASAGNAGSLCGSVQDPIAIYDATFSVGAYNSSNSLASFSSRGPVTIDGSGRIKPDIAAPGVGVYSAWRNGGYTYSQGTSMASPHVAGAAALLWSAVPALVGNVDMSEQALIKSATPVSAALCSDGAMAPVPNNLFGYGRLNAQKAVELALHPAQVKFAVTDDAGAPIASMTITLVDVLTGYSYAVTTDDAGVGVIEFIYAGEYDLSADNMGGTIPPTQVDIALGEGYGPVGVTADNGDIIRYTIVPRPITLDVKPRWFMPLVMQ
ncbi:MAG: S8 family serine peptidase [Caldilineaceae bacterium]|nr:S8 family serine peptidase [Caldilineaceae bacterium]